MAARRFELTATARDAGERLDRFLAERLASELVSRSLATRLCDEGLATVAGRPARPAYRLRDGDRVVAEVPPPQAPSAEPEDIALTVVYEDEAVLVLDKPAGMVVHPAKGHPRGTLVNAVLFHLGAAGRAALALPMGDSASVASGAPLAALVDDDREGSADEIELVDDPLRPGIVHRLDRDTSGVMVVAKTPQARESLRAQFSVHSTEREYVALCEGVLPGPATYDTAYGRHPRDRKRFSSRVAEGKRAVTHVRVLEALAGGAAAHVACVLETGRTHQIRVHLSEHGFPLLGDAMYGRVARHASLRPIAAALGRQALHARMLGFTHPLTQKRVRFERDPPADFSTALAALRALR